MRLFPLQTIRTKYKTSPTTGAARIYARASGGASLSISYPHELSGADCHEKAALALCSKLGWHNKLHCGALTDKGGEYVFTLLEKTTAAELSETEETKRGALIAEILKLKASKENGRFFTTWGDKTALGLFRTIQGIVEGGLPAPSLLKETQ